MEDQKQKQNKKHVLCNFGSVNKAVLMSSLHEIISGLCTYNLTCSIPPGLILHEREVLGTFFFLWTVVFSSTDVYHLKLWTGVPKCIVEVLVVPIEM